MQEENVLGRLKKSSILVTDVAGQAWCDRQMELNYLYGKKYTRAMAAGKELHGELEEEVHVPLEVEPITYADFLYKEGYEAQSSLQVLKSRKICRELHVYGSINAYRLSGKIDEIRIKDGKSVIIENKTVSLNARLSGSDISKRIFSEVSTRSHRVQVMLYRKMLSDIKEGMFTFDNFAGAYSLGRLAISERFKKELSNASIPDEMQSLDAVYKKVFEEIYAMPGLSDALEVHYIDRYSGQEIGVLGVDYTYEEMQKIIVHSLGYWNGERSAEPVSMEENWKCRSCKFFGKECRVWYNVS